MKTNHSRRVSRFCLTLLLLTLLGPAMAQLALAQQKSGDRYNDLIIEYLALEPQIEPGKARLTAFLFNLRDSDVYAAIDWAGAAERQEIGNLIPGESKAVSITIPQDAIPYDKPIVAQVYNMEIHKLEESDRATLHGEKAMRVALLVERRTWDAGNKKFGSFTRSMRASLESLHEAFADTSAPAEAGLARQPITDRFRIERVELFDRPADSMDTSLRPAIFDTHPNYDVVVLCDENGPFNGYWPEQYAVGYNFTAPAGENGLSSDAAERVLWKSLLQFRGVQDFSMYRIGAGALPGRCKDAIDLDEPFRDDLMNNPSKSPRIGALAAAIANSKAGIAQLGSCKDPRNEYGHVWRWLPRTVRLQIVDKDDKPVSGLKLKWYRSLPLETGDELQAVTADRPPIGSTTTDTSGETIIRGDYLGVRSAPDQRSLWLLVEAEDEAGTRRFAVLSGLWLNAAHAAGSKEEALWKLRLDQMREIR